MPTQNESIYIVTGASEGIGRAVATALASRELHVVAVARSSEKLMSLASEFRKYVKPVTADLSTDDGIENVAAAVGANAPIRGLVHCAGSLVPLEPYGVVNSTQLVEHFRIHVATPQALYQSLAKTHAINRMVYIDSYSAASARHGWSAYSIVKAAAQMSALCASQELAATDVIRVFPGAVNTQIVDTVLASETETATVFAGMRERGEFAEPSEVASFITTLLVDASDELIRSQPEWDYNVPTDREKMGCK